MNAPPAAAGSVSAAVVPSSAYVALADGAYASSALTRGPWDIAHQHAGPPIALVARALAADARELGMTHTARLTANLLRPIPIDALRVETARDYVGRNIAHLSARLLCGDRELARFTAVAQREVPLELPDPTHPPALPSPPRAYDASDPVLFPYRSSEIGYHSLMEMRVAKGTICKGPSAVWFRLRYPLVEGEAPGALERVAAAADSGNGISAMLPFDAYSFVNSDLTINLLRPLQGEWVCIDAHTFLGPAGGGLAVSDMFDVQGFVGRSTQSLAVRRRD